MYPAQEQIKIDEEAHCYYQITPKCPEWIMNIPPASTEDRNQRRTPPKKAVRVTAQP